MSVPLIDCGTMHHTYQVLIQMLKTSYRIIFDNSDIRAGAGSRRSHNPWHQQRHEENRRDPRGRKKARSWDIDLHFVQQEKS